MSSSTGFMRRATRADLPRIDAIRHGVRENRLSRPDAISPDLVLWFIDQPGIWVWEEVGDILGFSAGDTRDGSVWALFVDPAHEGRGIGRALLDQACSTLREAGFGRMRLTTEPGTRAEHFYRANGWRSVGTKGRELVFEKDFGTAPIRTRG